MHLHKYEKYWLMFGIGSLIIFLLITGLMALNNSHETPNSQKTINPEKVSEIAPFNKPGVYKVAGKHWDYEVVVVASAFYMNHRKSKFL